MRKDIIKNKIKEIYDSLDLIKNNLPDNYDNFQNWGLIKDGIYKRIEYSIENLLDIFYIVSSDLDLSIPYDDTDLIDNLYSNQIINKEIAFLMKNMKGFRNIVVHRDGKIDDRIAYTFIRENLNDFYSIIIFIENIMEKYWKCIKYLKY